MVSDPQKGAAESREWSPFASRRVRLIVGAAIPLYAIWLIFHSSSFMIVNGVIAAVGPIAVSMIAGTRQRDWRFIAIAVAYAAIIYWMSKDLMAN